MKEFPPFRLDLVNQCLWRSQGTGEQRLLLTPKAFAMLRYLVEHAGRLVTQDELLEALWSETYVQPEVLKSHIRDIRAVLGDDSKTPRFIETLPRRGYQFIAAVTESSHHVASDATPAATGRLVGRNAELDRLQGSLQRALRGDRQILFITGEPGIGKTALVDAFQRQAAAVHSRLLIARGQCVEGYGGKEPYYPMLEALGHLCHGPAAESVGEVLAAQAPTWLVQFPSLVRREQRESLQREIIGATRERMLREIADALEKISAESPILLLFEDLHWVDPSTVDLMSVLARRRQPAKLLLMSTYRPVEIALADHPLKALKQDLLIRHLCHEIALEPLTEAQVSEYLGAESHGFAVPEGLARLVYRHSEGNPLFMVAALDHMCNRGLIALENGAWQMKKPLESIDLEAPESLRQMIELQIERLSVDEKNALEVMSVLRRIPLSAAVGAAVANLEPEIFEELLDRLARKHQVIRSAGFKDSGHCPSPVYEFVHVLYRQVLYSRMGLAKRRKLHQSAAANAEKLYVSPEVDLAAELAYQFEEGGDWLRAVQYLQITAHTAGRRFEPRQAAAILEHALELANRIPEEQRAQSEIHILQRLATICAASFDPRAFQAYETLAARAGHHRLPEIELRALLEMAVASAGSSPDLYRRAVDRASEALSRTGEGDTLTRAVMRVRIRALTGSGKLDPQELEESKKLVVKLREAGERLLLGEAQFGISYPLFNSSQYREAQRSAEESFAILLEDYGENPYLTWHFHVYMHLVTRCHLFLGEWGKGLRTIEHWIEMADKNGDRLGTTMARLGQAPLRLEAMDFAGALQVIESALPVVSQIPSVRRYCLIHSGFAEAGLGNGQRALEYLLACRDEIGQHPQMADWYNRMLLQYAFTEVWLSEGDLVQARMEAEQFLKVTLTNGERTFRGLAFEAKARVAMGEGELPEAQDCIVQALQAIEGFEVPLAYWRVHATAYELCERLEQDDRAKKHRKLSQATIMQLADSLPPEEPLRRIFLSAPAICRILDNSRQAPACVLET